MPAVHPLPPRPNLEYERKEAKALIRRLRAGDLDALARAHVQHPGLDAATPSRARLADAQLVIAREYGFASWPRLVRYFGDVARHQFAHRQIHGGRDALDAHVRGVLADHRARRPWVARSLGAYLPQFYGNRADMIFAAPITEDDARLVVARSYGAPSWQVLLERAAGGLSASPWEPDPMRDVAAAMAASDLGELERIVAAYPGLLEPADQDVARCRTLIAMAVGQEKRYGMAAMRPVMDWLAAHGFDRQRELNFRLCGPFGVSVEEVRDLLDRGADPNWMPPNGIPVLEHALLRYWNGEAVDLVAARTTPRHALWIAAGLGDVDGVRRFLDHKGRPTAAAHRMRPDFDAAGPPGMPSQLDPDDDELLLEAFFVAMLNGRTAVLSDMAARGAPVNSLVYGAPILSIAVGNGMTAAVECLVRCGADLDLHGAHGESARDMARELFEQTPDDANRRRIVELCGMDPDVLLAEHNVRPAPTPSRLPMFEQALALAGDDAARLDQPDVRPENLLIGLLRVGGPPLHVLAESGRMDLPRFRRDLADRLRPASERVEPRKLPMRGDAQAAIEAAVSVAMERRSDDVHGIHLLRALTHDVREPVSCLLARYGVDAAALTEALTRWS